jgi:hypothetical protein
MQIFTNNNSIYQKILKKREESIQCIMSKPKKEKMQKE